MPDNKVDQKITDRSAEEFSKLIESGELYEELKNKDSERKEDNSKGNTEKRKNSK